MTHFFWRVRWAVRRFLGKRADPGSVVLSYMGSDQFVDGVVVPGEDIEVRASTWIRWRPWWQVWRGIQ